MNKQPEVHRQPRDQGPASPAEWLSRRLWRLDSGKLCTEATRRTGLEDFGNPPLEPAFSTLCSSLEQEANLHPLGRFLMRMHLRDLLETRLRLAAAWKEAREALVAARIEKPVFIVGMPRSGSTFLHELLAQDPHHRAPRVWEVMFPLASARAGHSEEARRIRKAAVCLWWFRRLAPRADAVYPMRAQTPHECVAIHSHTFLSAEFASTCRIPGYEAFLHSADLIPTYDWERRFLQYLQLHRPARRWILKSPDHVYGLEQLFSVFADAFIIQTHRNPVEVLKSSADLTRVLQGLYGRPGDFDEIRAREARLLALGTELCLQFRDRHPEWADRFIDLKYTDLVANPMAAVGQVYARLDTPLTETAAVRMQALASKRSQYRGRRASSEPVDLKLGTALETSRFERYCARFGLPFREADLR